MKPLPLTLLGLLAFKLAIIPIDQSLSDEMQLSQAEPTNAKESAWK